MSFNLQLSKSENIKAMFSAPKRLPVCIQFRLPIAKWRNIRSPGLSQLLDNASERGVRKIKIKQNVRGCFRTDSGADDFAKLHSIAETAMKNRNSKFNVILAVVQQ